MTGAGYGFEFEAGDFIGMRKSERAEREYIAAAEAWLSSYLGLYDEIAAAEAEKESLYTRATGITPRRPGNGGGGGGKQGRAVEEYLKGVERCEEKIERLLEEQKRIREAIESLPGSRERNVLTYLFISGYSIQVTAELLGCERHAVSRRKRRALAQLIIPAEKNTKKCTTVFQGVPQ